MRTRGGPREVLFRTLRCAWLLLAMVLVGAPYAALLVSMLAVPASEWTALAMPFGGRAMLLLRSVGLSASAATLSTGVGLLTALLLWRVPSRVRVGVTWGALGLAAVPPYVHALVWSHVLGPAGWPAAIWVQAAWFAPVAVALCVAGIDETDPELFDAARMHVPAWRALWIAVLPPSRAHQLASFALCFAVGLLDFSVPSLYHVDVYALDVFAELGATDSPGRAVWMSLPLVLIAALATSLLWRGMRVVGSGRSQSLRPRGPIQWPPVPMAVVFSCGLTALAWAAVPLVALAWMTGSMTDTLEGVIRGSSELRTTLWVSAMAAWIAVAIGRTWADQLRARGWRRAMAWVLLWIPWVLPPPLIGLGLVQVWNHAALEPLLQSRWMLVLASVERFTPCAALVMWAAHRQRDPDLQDAIRIHQRNAWHGWLHVGFGLERTGWIAASALVLALSAGELGASLLVAPPGYPTLTMRLYNYLHAGASRSVAGSCLTMWLLTLSSGLVAWAALRHNARRGMRSSP